jgi:hypothetical protein
MNCYRQCSKALSGGPQAEEWVRPSQGLFDLDDQLHRLEDDSTATDGEHATST